MLGLEQLEERARALAARFVVSRDPARGAIDLLGRLLDDAGALRQAYSLCAGDVHQGEAVAPAAEWLLDNFHLVEGEITEVRRNLPSRFYRRLPRLASREPTGSVRVFAMAVELLRHSDARLDARRLERFVVAFQTVAPLSLGELWAWPSMLKLALIRHLRRLADDLVASRAARLEADRCFEAFEQHGDLAEFPERLTVAFVDRLLQRMREYGAGAAELRRRLEERLASTDTTLEAAVRSDHQRKAQGQVSMGNCVTSLRLCTTFKWDEYVERVSLVEQILRRDPAGIHARTDFRTRDLCRHAVEELSEPTGEAQVRVALRAIESARQAVEHQGPGAPEAHVGYHLLGRGRREFVLDVGLAPLSWPRVKRALKHHAGTLYLGTIGLLTALAVGLAVAWARTQAAADELLPWVALLALVPASELAVSWVQRIVHRLVPPRHLPRLDLRGGIPVEARTMVVVPTLLTSAEGLHSLLEQLEVRAIGNDDPHLHFALLTDFPDAASEHLPGERELLDSAIAGIEELNARHPLGPGSRFYLFHRARRWNPREGVWMGWERKRGKLEEFNRLLRGATDTSFDTSVGDLSILAVVRYCLTLDTDTRLPRDVAAHLIGVIEHPLHRPRFDPSRRRVVEGYGILQPRVSITMASAARSAFARAYSGHVGVDPYSSAVSDTYQDLFDEGIFTGKGLYDVDAFRATLEGRVPENAMLSHDLYEGLFARCALVTDVEVVDDFPSSVLAHARRQHRWVRGDWQILFLLLPWVPTPTGLERNRLPLVSRWKVFDNLRRSLVAPALIAWLVSAWTWLPGSPLVWTLAALAVLATPWVTVFGRLLRGPRPHQPVGVFLGDLQAEASTAAAQVVIDVVFLAYRAYEMLDAILVTLVRMVITQRRLLEWEAAAVSAARAAGLVSRRGIRVYAAEMWSGPTTAVLVFTAIVRLRPDALPASAAFLLLWTASPAVAWWLSRPARLRRPAPNAADAELMRRIACRTWSYFDRFVQAEDHLLPPDNVQEVPETRIAHRTSPTNLGMGLLATLAARDLGYLRTPDMAERLERMLGSIESLERHAGHLLNWYDSGRAAALLPRYVSTVDSGNLAASLMTLAAGLREPWTPADDDARARAGTVDVLGVMAESLSAMARAAHAAAALRKVADEARRLVADARASLTGTGPARRRLERFEAERPAIHAALERVWALAPAGAAADELAEWERRLVTVAPAVDVAPVQARLTALAGRCDALADGMRWSLLFDRERELFSIGYRLADAEGPGRLDPSFYDLLASEARVASFIAIARGEVPQEHWFRLWRPLTNAEGTTALVSWSGSMFEYLMPLLFMRGARRDAARRHVPERGARPDPPTAGGAACRGGSPSPPTPWSTGTRRISTARSACRGSASSAGSPTTW